MNRPPGGSNRPGPSLCPPRAGNIAGVIGDALVMGSAAPILLRFVVACRTRVLPVRRSGALVRAPPPVATPGGAGSRGRGAARRADPAASPPGRHGPFRGRGGVPSAPGGRRAGAPAAHRPGGERGGEGGGGGAAPLLPAPLPCGVARGPRPCHPSSLARPPGVYTRSGGCRAAVGAGRGPLGRQWVSVAGGGGGGGLSAPVRSPPFPRLAPESAASFPHSWVPPFRCWSASGNAGVSGRSTGGAWREAALAAAVVSLPRVQRPPGGGCGAAVSPAGLRPPMGWGGGGGGGAGVPSSPDAAPRRPQGGGLVVLALGGQPPTGTHSSPAPPTLWVPDPRAVPRSGPLLPSPSPHGAGWPGGGGEGR